MDELNCAQKGVPLADVGDGGGALLEVAHVLLVGRHGLLVILHAEADALGQFRGVRLGLGQRAEHLVDGLRRGDVACESLKGRAKYALI